MASNRVYKAIPKGQGKAPVKTVKRQAGLKTKDSDKLFELRMQRIREISAGMGENLAPASPTAPAKKVHPIETRKTIPYGATGSVIKYIFDEQQPGDEIFEDIEGM